MNKTEKYLSRALLPMAVGVAALGWLAWRPCEPQAHASTPQEPQHIVLPEQVIIADRQIPVISVEDLPKASPKHVAGASRKSPTECTRNTPGARCSVEDLTQGSGTVLFCDCRK